MTTFEHTIEIAAPLETVFAFDSDPENWPRTMPSLRNLEIVERTETGARMRSTYKLLGRSLDTELEMTVVEPNERLHVTVVGSGMNGAVENHFSATDAGTQIALEADYEFGDSVLERLLEPVATRYTNRQFRTHLQNTKDLIEAEVAAEAPTPAAA
ncbi:SRPBCC family protein [Halobellus sp. GM3]|uniref:SRPBCC family protein n=1 Tax=Halobellus sp. GM3 TaxID=3458410 RepID=UPI00403E2A46